MRRTSALVFLIVALVSCGAEPIPVAPAKKDDAAKPANPAEPAKPTEPAVVTPDPEPKPTPAFMSEPERLNPNGLPWADHERRVIDTTGLARRGSEKTGVVVLGCIDMRDPYCKKGQRNMAEVLAAFPDDVALYLRPYWNVLESSEVAAMGGDKAAIALRDLTELLATALVAAEQQGKLWELHDRILEAEVEQLTRDGLAKLAADAGLDVAQWKAALDTEATKTAVDAHKQACNTLGVDRGVPTYFINGRMMKGAAPTEAIRYLVELELAGGFEALTKP
jgi:protein-disulfide isomerase